MWQLQCNVVSTPLSCLLIHQHLSSLCSALVRALGQLKGNKPTPLVWLCAGCAHTTHTQRRGKSCLHFTSFSLTWQCSAADHPVRRPLQPFFRRDLLSGANQPWTTFWHAFAKNSFPFPPARACIYTREGFFDSSPTHFSLLLCVVVRQIYIGYCVYLAVRAVNGIFLKNETCCCVGEWPQECAF